MGEENKQIYFVCGGGHQGLAMAAHLALNGEKVTLWNRTPEHIDEIMRTGRIYCSGEVNGIAKIGFKTKGKPNTTGSLIPQIPGINENLAIDL